MVEFVKTTEKTKPPKPAAEKTAPEPEPARARSAAPPRSAPAHAHAAAPASDPAAAPVGKEADPAAGIKITREDVNVLPLRGYTGPIELVRDDAALAAALETLRREPILGFDTESRPSFSRGQNFPVALVQLATEEKVFLIQLRPIQDFTGLRELFSDARIIKTGVAVAHDVQKLRDFIGDFTPGGFVDLAHLTTAAGVHNTGLRGLTAILLGFRISKGAQRSNWALERLSPAQIAYAATDAWISRELYLEVQRRGWVPEKLPDGAALPVSRRRRGRRAESRSPAPAASAAPETPAPHSAAHSAAHRAPAHDSSAPRALIIADDDYEDLELWYPRLRLEEAGCRVVVAGRERGCVMTGKHGYPCTADAGIAHVRSGHYDALVLPGGFAPDRLRRDPNVRRLVREFNDDRKPIAMICHGGWIAISAGIVRERRLTGSAGIQDDLVNAGARWEDAPVVCDGHLISARGPRDLPAFLRALLAALFPPVVPPTGTDTPPPENKPS